MITADKRLRTLGLCGYSLYIAGDVERQLFAKLPDRFVEQDFTNEVKLQPLREVGVSLMSVEDAIDLLPVVLREANADGGLEWEPDGDSLPNSPWLVALYQYLCQKGLAVVHAGKELKALALVPEQWGRLRRMGSPKRRFSLPIGSSDRR